MIDFAVLGFAILILLIAVFLFVNKPKGNEIYDFSEFNRLKQENEDLKVKVATLAQQVKGEENQNVFLIKSHQDEKQDIEFKYEQRINKLETDKSSLAYDLSFEKSKLSKAEEAFKAQQQRLADQKLFLEESEIRFKTEFENVANAVLREKTKEFTDVNRTNLDILLNPLKENIKAFEEKVEKVYKSESDERNVLKGEISKLMELNRQIGEDATNLTKALKGDNKKQGNWGEMVLDKLLEGSGLIEGTNYSKQSSFTSQDGNRLQPDVIIYLPDEKHLVIDSKVSLVAYEKLVNAENDLDRELFIKHHISSIKTHISGLSNKNYHDLYQINSPDYVMLFMPIESSFAVAFQTDRDLFEFAWNKRVVIVTPSTLLATLKTVSSIWKQELQTRNAIDIATKAGQLYDKFVGFIVDLQKVGDQLDKSQKVYSEAMNKLTNGKGNLVGRVETLRILGAKNTKELDKNLLDE